MYWNLQPKLTSLMLTLAALSLFALHLGLDTPAAPISSQLQLSPASYYKIIAKWSLNPTLVIHVSKFPPAPFSITLPTPHYLPRSSPSEIHWEPRVSSCFLLWASLCSTPNLFLWLNFSATLRLSTPTSSSLGLLTHLPRTCCSYFPHIHCPGIHPSSVILPAASYQSVRPYGYEITVPTRFACSYFSAGPVALTSVNVNCIILRD